MPSQVTLDTLRGFLDAFNRHDLDAIMDYFHAGTRKSGGTIAVRGVDLLEFRNGKVIRKDSFWKILE